MLLPGNFLDINLYQLKTFHAVARRMSFSKAAEDLMLTQPAVSRQISGLEKFLGAKLFTKKGRGITLTLSGKCLYEQLDHIFELIEDAVRTTVQTSNLKKGTIRLGICSSAPQTFLSQVMLSFYARFPDIELDVYTGNSQWIIELAQENRIDVGIILGVWKRANIQLEPLISEPLVKISHTKESIGLSSSTFLIRETGSGLRLIQNEYLEEINGTLSKVMELTDIQLILNLVSRGYGWTVLPKTLIPPHFNISIHQEPLSRYKAEYFIALPKSSPPLAQTLSLIHVLQRETKKC